MEEVIEPNAHSVFSTDEAASVKGNLDGKHSQEALRPMETCPQDSEKAITKGDAIVRPHPGSSRTHPRDMEGSVSLQHTVQRKIKPRIMGVGSA